MLCGFTIGLLAPLVAGDTLFVAASSSLGVTVSVCVSGVVGWLAGVACPFALKVARAHTHCEFGCGAMESLNPFRDCCPALPFSRVAARQP